ncbi:MAG TPA: PPE domain-containing protein [Aldersonia sp.]
MTVGITGVVWLPRTAPINSAALHAGAHGTPLTAAAASWASLGAAYAEATVTAARVIAELSLGLQGGNGTLVAAKLTQFGAWTERTAASAVAMSAKTAASATAYSVAALAMPSPPEIAAVKAAKAAAYSTGGALNGTAEATEAADRAMDVRAAVVMEAYEAATTATVLTPSDFAPAPHIAAGAADPSAEHRETPAANPVQAAALAAGSLAQHPAAQTAAAQAGQLAGSVTSSTLSAAGNLASGNLPSTVTPTVSTSSANTASAPFLPMAGTAGATSRVGTDTRAAATAGVGHLAPSPPAAWATHGVLAHGPAPDQTSTGTYSARTEPIARTGPVGGPLLGARPGADDDLHDTPAYLHSIEHFADGRTVIAAVIGDDPEIVG